MPCYSLFCPNCEQVSEHVMGCDDVSLHVKCPVCARSLTRQLNRDLVADVRTIHIQGDTVAGGCSYDYYDENLGVQVRSKQHRKEEMLKQGLREYSPDPEFKKIRDERMYIKKHSNRRDPEAKAQLKSLSVEAQHKRRKKQVDKAFDSVPLPNIPID
jgi:hypothetical protein